MSNQNPHLQFKEKETFTLHLQIYCFIYDTYNSYDLHLKMEIVNELSTFASFK